MFYTCISYPTTQYVFQIQNLQPLNLGTVAVPMYLHTQIFTLGMNGNCTYLCIYKEVSTYLLLAHSSITYNYRKRGFFCVYVWSTKLASFTLLKTWENEQPKRKVGIKTASFKIHLDLSKKYTLDLYFSWGKLQKNIYSIGIYIWHVEGIYVVLL